MPSTEFSLLLSASDLEYLRDALTVGAAVKVAQGDTSGSDALNTLREKVDTAAPVRHAAPTTARQGDRTGDVYNMVSGGSPKNLVQCRDIDGNIDLR